MSNTPWDDLSAGLRLHLADLTPRQRARVVARAGGLGATPRMGLSELEAAGVSGQTAAALLALSRTHVEAERERAARCGVDILCSGDPSWPPLLGETPDPPAVLWVRGRLPLAETPSMAIVGARHPTAYGLAVTSRLARELAQAGLVLVSGGARGIDSVAHEAALAAGAPTVAVLGCGVDVAYPREHDGLFGRIASAGAVVSEHPLGTRPRPHHFPVRNRLLAGWTRGVLVTEATLRSGSLITARLALDLGREVMAVPGPITSRASEGCNELLARGAKLVRDGRDVLGELSPEVAKALAAAALEAGGTPPGTPADPLLEVLSPSEPSALEQLAARTGLPPGQLLARLVRLEAQGSIRALAGGRWVRSR